MRATTRIGVLIAAAAFAGGGAVAAGAADGGADNAGATEAECIQLKHDINAAMNAGASKQEIEQRFGDRMKACDRAFGMPQEEERRAVDPPPMRDTAECRALRERFEATIQGGKEADMRQLKEDMSKCMLDGPKPGPGGCGEGKPGDVEKAPAPGGKSEEAPAPDVKSSEL